MAAFTERPALAEDQAGLAMTPDPGPRLRRRKMVMIGGGALAGVLLIAIIAGRGGSSSDRPDKSAATDKAASDRSATDKSATDRPADKATGKPTDKPAEPPVKPAGKPADTAPGGSAAPADEGPSKVISDATALIGEGKPDAALARIAKGRKQYFANPDLPYFAGRIHFSRQHYTEGIASFRDAIKLDDSFRSNPELIQMLVDGFTTTKERNAQIAGFLHDVIGNAAVPILERATREHPDPAMRERVTKELARYQK